MYRKRRRREGREGDFFPSQGEGKKETRWNQPKRLSRCFGRSFSGPYALCLRTWASLATVPVLVDLDVPGHCGQTRAADTAWPSPGPLHLIHCQVLVWGPTCWPHDGMPLTEAKDRWQRAWAHSEVAQYYVLWAPNTFLAEEAWESPGGAGIWTVKTKGGVIAVILGHQCPLERFWRMLILGLHPRPVQSACKQIGHKSLFLKCSLGGSDASPGRRPPGPPS